MEPQIWGTNKEAQKKWLVLGETIWYLCLRKNVGSLLFPSNSWNVQHWFITCVGTPRPATSPERAEKKDSREEVTHLMGPWERLELASPALQRTKFFSA